MTPRRRYRHHCPECVLLGRHGRHDLYCCVSPDGVHMDPGTLWLCVRERPAGGNICGHARPEWLPALTTENLPAYRKALRLAAARGLVRKDEADALLSG
jgi:hypothetical protein